MVAAEGPGERNNLGSWHYGLPRSWGSRPERQRSNSGYVYGCPLSGRRGWSSGVQTWGVGRSKGSRQSFLASLFDMAKLPAVAALCERGGGIGTFDNTVLAIEQSEGGVCHPPTMCSSDLHQHRTGTLSDRTRLAVRVEVAGSFDYEAFGVVDGSGEGGGEEGVVIRLGIKREAMNGELEVGGGESEGLPGVVGDGEGLIEAGGESLKKGRIGSGKDGGFNNRECNGVFTIDKGLE